MRASGNSRRIPRAHATGGRNKKYRGGLRGPIVRLERDHVCAGTFWTWNSSGCGNSFRGGQQRNFAVAVLDNDMRVLTISWTPSSSIQTKSHDHIRGTTPLGSLNGHQIPPLTSYAWQSYIPTSTVCNGISSCGPLTRVQDLRGGGSLRPSFCGCDQDYRVPCGLISTLLLLLLRVIAIPRTKSISLCFLIVRTRGSLPSSSSSSATNIVSSTSPSTRLQCES